MSYRLMCWIDETVIVTWSPPSLPLYHVCFAPVPFRCTEAFKESYMSTRLLISKTLSIRQIFLTTPSGRALFLVCVCVCLGFSKTPSTRSLRARTISLSRMNWDQWGDSALMGDVLKNLTISRVTCEKIILCTSELCVISITYQPF